MNLGKVDLYSKGKRNFLNSVSLSTLAWNRDLLEGNDIIEVIIVGMKDIEGQLLEGNIRESKYNNRYREIMTKELPKYLLKCSKDSDISIIARIRCVSFKMGNRYWLKEENKLCIL